MERDPRFDIVGNPVVAGRGSQVGIRIIEKGQGMAKAETNGVYELNGTRFTIKAGDVLPDGATLEQVPEPVAEQDEVEQRDRGPAANNRKQPGPAPQNRSQGS